MIRDSDFSYTPAPNRYPHERAIRAEVTFFAEHLFPKREEVACRGTRELKNRMLAVKARLREEIRYRVYGDVVKLVDRLEECFIEVQACHYAPERRLEIERKFKQTLNDINAVVQGTYVDPGEPSGPVVSSAVEESRPADPPSSPGDAEDRSGR